VKPAWRRILWAAAGLYVAALTVVNLLPSGRPYEWDREIPPQTQNIAHVPAYALLVMLLAWAWAAGWRVSIPALVILAAVCLGHGLVMEYLQGYVPGRRATMPDVLYNAAGVPVGFAAAAAWIAWRSRRGDNSRGKDVSAT